MVLASQQGWKRCGKCGHMVERSSGCNHMHCAGCGHHFCYRCGGDFDRARYQCLNEGCGIFQEEDGRPGEQTVAGRLGFHAGLLGMMRGMEAWRRAGPPELTEERRAVLARMTDMERPYLDLERNMRRTHTLAILMLPAWHREMLQNLRCPYCRQTTSRFTSLERHIRLNCRSPVFACCARIFIDAEEMNVHVHHRHRH